MPDLSALTVDALRGWQQRIEHRLEAIEAHVERHIGPGATACPSAAALTAPDTNMTRHYDDRPLRYDDTYIGARYTYGLTYRPLSSSNVPRDWILFSDRPHPDFRHGTVQYPRQLTSGEIAAFQLTPLLRRFAHCHSNSCVWHDERAADDPAPFPDYCPDCWSGVDVSAEGDSPIDEG